MNLKQKNTNLIWHNATVTKTRRETKNKHKGAALWFTGLSGSGKSTLAHSVEELLYQQGISTCVLDGDNVRHGLCADLTFSDADRKENIRRISHMSQLFVEAGVVVLTAFISPFRQDRENARKIVGEDFYEIYCDCSLDVCESRDVKGLYKKARAGEIPFFTGIDSPYEKPETPELNTKTDSDLEKSIDEVYSFIMNKIAL